MKKVFLAPVWFGLAVSLFGLNGLAKVRLNAQCSFLPNGSEEVQGVRTQERIKIASLSKIFVSYWAIATLGPEFRFKTHIHIIDPEDPKLIKLGYKDVHIQGGLSPYFSIHSLQFLVAELNKRGLSKINVLTFDENFKYSTNIVDNKNLTVTGLQITTNSSLAYLKKDVRQINHLYEINRKQSKNNFNINLPSQLKLDVKSVAHLPSKNFFKPDDARSFLMLSSPLATILKEMNRNSHNYTADLIFNFLGGSDKFEFFMAQRLGYEKDQVQFINGSGYPVDGVYNEATCEAIIRSTWDMNTILSEKYKASIADVLSVAGVDANAVSSVTRIYATEDLNRSLIAKTGTIKRTIALGGALHTPQGTIYFASLQGIDSHLNEHDRYGAYNEIRKYLIQQYNRNGGSSTFAYKAKAFNSFDENSSLKEIKKEDLNPPSNELQLADKS